MNDELSFIIKSLVEPTQSPNDMDTPIDNGLMR